MTNTKTTNYVQTVKDKRLIEAIEYVIFLSKRKGQKFQLKEIAPDFELTPSNYIQIRRGLRGFTQSKIPEIVSTLHEKYGVHLDFLNFGHKPIMINGDDTMIKDDGRIAELLKTKLQTLQKRITYLEATIRDKEKIIETQGLLLDSFKNRN